jgi:hypothetical protein
MGQNWENPISHQIEWKQDKVATLSLGDMESLAINIGVNGAWNKYQVQYVSVG